MTGTLGKVYIVGSSPSYERMYKDNGYVVTRIDEADFIQFTGGADVNPELYDEECHPRTGFSPIRDRADSDIFNYAFKRGMPMVGICRGAQFLNVANGGKMWQDVNNHAIGGEHIAVDVRSGEMVPVTSTHHQMMRPADNGQVLMVASEATYLENMEGTEVNRVTPERGTDVEAVWYPNTKSLCYQPHPEIRGKDHPCQQYFFKILRNYIQGGLACAA